jgi:hypothetical protein
MISEHISLKEATSSPTATRLGIDNIPSSAVISKMEKVANRCFEPIRKWYGKPIKINSFYRSQDLNKAVGGSSSSQHCLGEAIDIDAEQDNKKLFDWILKNLEFDQVIWEFGNDIEPDWIHISYTELRPNRNEVLRAVKKNGKTVYKKY